MKSMFAYVVPNKDGAQNNYEKLKGESTFIWSVPSTAQDTLIPNTEWVIINSKKNIVFLAKVTQYVTGTTGKDSNTTKVNGLEIEGDFIGKLFVQSDIIEEHILSDKFTLPSLGAGTGNVLFNLAQKHKTRIIATRNALLEELPTSSKIYQFLKYEEDLDDCIAYKENNKWGFLFYSKKSDGSYDFVFEPVKNVDADGKKLTESQEGYRDFVYFIASLGHPRAIKIGRSDNPTKRFNGLKGANPANLSLLLVLPDGRKEKMYHKIYGEYMIDGKEEWFWDDLEIRRFVKQEAARYEHIKNLYNKSKQ